MFSSDVHFLSYTKVNANWVYKFNKKNKKKDRSQAGSNRRSCD